MPFSHVFELAAGSSQPLSVQIARAVAADVARGRLKAGERLPGSRKLASMLGVHRNTVNAALAELAAEGWVEARPQRGVFVRAPGPGEASSKKITPKGEIPARPGFLLSEQRTRIGEAPPEELLILTGGVADPRLFPGELVARAYRRALRRRGEALLDYGDAHGEPRLRAALAAMLAGSRGLAVRPEQLLVTRGTQQALWLAARAMITPGERIGVECLGYPPAWDAFRDAGATLVPLSLDAEGVRVESVEAALREGPLRALYLTPHHQYPTMVALSARRKLRLLELARQHRFAIIEDDYSHEFQYEGRPRLPMASSDPSGQVVYVGSLSKILAPGLRIGYAVAPQPLIDRMAAVRTFVDRQGDAIAEAAIAELLEDGDVARHARRMRGIYERRREALVRALGRELGEQVSFNVPQGGMALWIEVHGVKPELWVDRALERGVVFKAGSTLALDGKSIPFVRMGFTRLDERELARAVKEAAKALSAGASPRSARRP